jgi:hypothetical protein
LGGKKDKRDVDESERQLVDPRRYDGSGFQGVERKGNY